MVSGDLPDRTDRTSGGRRLAAYDRRSGDIAVRLADVLHRGLSDGTFFRLLALVAIWKSVEIAVLGSFTGALPMLCAGLLVFLRRELGAGMIALACLAIIATPGTYGQPAVNHLTWVFWIAASASLFRGDQQRFVFKAQLSIMYGFAAIAKVWPDFLTGAALASRTWLGAVTSIELLIAVSWATLIVEAGLAVGVWLRRPWWTAAFAAAVGLHTSFLLFTVTDPWRVGRLVIFGGLSVAVWLRAVPRGADEGSKRRLATRRPR